MSYMIAFRDTEEKEQAMEKLHEAKVALMEACKMLDDAEDDSTSMNERRGHYRGGRYRREHEMGGRYDY